MKRPEIGARVTVHDFGSYTGRVIEHDPWVKIQGRTVQAKGWIKVELDQPAPTPTWSGALKLIREIK